MHNNTDIPRAIGNTRKRNPIWSREELILALDLYLRNRHSLPGPKAAEVASLSKYLATMGRTLGRQQGETYRNPNGVAMKLQNFKRFDPAYLGKGKRGLSRGNKDEQAVWDDFAHDEVLLSAIVIAIRSTVAVHSVDGKLALPTDVELVEAPEGQLLARLHKYRERSKRLVKRRKELALAQNGALVCETCGFNFSEKYGSLGEGVIEVHHTRPLHTLIGGEATKLAELALVCANCHRVIHARKKWLTLAELKEGIHRMKKATR